MKDWMEGVTAVLETVGSLSASTQNISGRCYQPGGPGWRLTCYQNLGEIPLGLFWG